MKQPSEQYKEVVKDLIWYYEHQLSITIFWKDWSKSIGCFDPNHPIFKYNAQKYRNDYAKSISEYRNKLRTTHQLMETLNHA